MFKFDTMSPLGYLVPMLSLMTMSFADEDGGSEEGTALPEGITFDGITTVEELGAQFKALQDKPPTGLDSLADDYKNDANISKYNGNIEELAKGHLELVKMVGKKGTIIPGENATDEEKSKFYKDLGRPDTANDYKLDFAEGLNPGLKSSEDTQKWLKETGHKLGLSQAQLGSLYNDFNTMQSNMLDANDAATEKSFNESSTALRTKWAGDFDNNVALANRVANQLGGEEFVSKLGDLKNNVPMLEFLANVGAKMSEDSLALGRVSSLTGTPQDAKAKIKSMSAQLASMKGTEPGYQDLVKERSKLYELAYPSGGN